VAVILPEPVIGRYCGFGVDTEGFSVESETVDENGAM